MKEQQPEALRLADWLLDHVGHLNHAEAAAELRRLHEELESHRRVMFRLGQVNAQLLEALESIAKNTCCDRCQEAALVARAAIKAVKGEA